MPEVSKTVIKLASELLKHQAKNVLGDSFMETLAQSFKDFVGNDTAEKMNNFLSAGDNAEKLLSAFKDADESFRTEGDDILQQMIVSKPLAGLESLEKLANILPQKLDSENLLIALQQRFEDDWSNQSNEIHVRAAHLYRTCLERSLAVRCNQILPAIFIKVERIETNTEKLLEGQKEILDAIKSIQFSKSTAFSLLYTIRKPPTDFIGRTGEIDDLLTHFKDGVSIFGFTGSGGIGKTALARLLASRLADQFTDARLEIDLQGVPYRTQTPLTTANAMRRLLQPFYPEKTLPDDVASLNDLYVGTFSQRRALLLLDNAHNAAQVRPLLPPAPSVALVTSRADLSGLSANGIYAIKIDTLSLDDARPLLRTISPRLKDTADKEVDTITMLCGSLPLALRVIASVSQQRLDWTTQTLIQRLSDEKHRLSVLKLPDDPDLDVEASLSLSYALLSSEMQQRFQKLSVFPAPFDLKAVSSVWDEPELTCDETIGQFVSLSLVDVNLGDVSFYKLHDLTRLYADSLLSENTEVFEVTHLRHARHYANVIYSVSQLLTKGGDAMLAGLQLFDTERKHIEAGQAWTAKNLLNHAAAQICTQYGGRGIVQLLRLLPPERIQWLEPSLQANRILKDRNGECVDLGNLGLAYDNMNEPRKAINYYEQQLVIAREIGDQQSEGNALGNLGNAYSHIGEQVKAIEYHEQALAISRNEGNHRKQGIDLGDLGVKYMRLGEPQKAIDHWKQALDFARETGDLNSECAWLMNLGQAFNNLDEPNKAIDYYERALTIARKIGDKNNEGEILRNLSNLYMMLGELHKATEYQEQSLTVSRDLQDRRSEGTTLGNMGIVYRNLGEPHKAIEHYQQALIIAREFGDLSSEGAWLGNLGLAYGDIGEIHKSIECHEQSLAISRKLGGRGSESSDLGNLGIAHHELGETQKAIEYYKDQLIITREIGERRGEANALGSLGNSYNVLNETQKAIEYYEQALAIDHEIGYLRGEGYWLGNLGQAYNNINEPSMAVSYFERALSVLREIGDKRGEAMYSWSTGLLLVKEGEFRRAVDVMQMSVDYWRAIGTKDLEKFERYLEQVRSKIK